MGELSITVSIPGSCSSTYQFSDPIVRIGRSPDCHLTISHEAVPRDLCSCWLEEEGNLVRVEERSGLTNPLLVDRKRVIGGISGAALTLQVGPVFLDIEPAKSVTINRSSANRRSPRTVLIAALAVVAIGVMLLPTPDEKAGSIGPDVLPRSPLPEVSVEPCPSSHGCKERSDLLISRADALLDHAHPSPADQIRAIGLLTHAAELVRSTSKKTAERLSGRVAVLERRVLAAYRREVLALMQALETGDSPRTAAAARNVAAYLGDRDQRAHRWLQSLMVRAAP